MLCQFIIFGILGIFGEVVFTAVVSAFKTRRLRFQGFSFVWMFPIYGLLAFLFPPVAHAVATFPWIARGLVYMAGIYAVEYIIGSILTILTGSHIWRYEDSWNYKGQITLTFAPVWFGVGLLVEKFFPVITNISKAISAVM